MPAFARHQTDIITRIVEALDREVTKQVRRGRIYFTERYPRPSKRTLERIYQVIRNRWYELTPSLEREIARFELAYDRDAKYRMDLIQVDCKVLDAAWLASQGHRLHRRRRERQEGQCCSHVRH